jgi:hypothetical protein
VRTTFGSVAEQVAIYRESRFTQFSKSASPGTLNGYQDNPLPVLRAADNGFGIGQLTDSPVPSVPDLWSWSTNAADAAQKFAALRAQVQQHLANTKATDPQMPDMTPDQLDLEMWKLYNSGHYYHTYGAAHHKWIPDPNAYADSCLKTPPAGRAGPSPARKPRPRSRHASVRTFPADGPEVCCEPAEGVALSAVQKLVTIQMKAKDGEQQEQLASYTSEGWRIVSVSAAGAGQDTYRSFLVAVVLEKP